ncbi:HlyC/CorC family transporter [Arenicella xantha]|uniref:Magnesium and cobalt efflux protein CorC n=1 Tax=Arenicella xantha TaxID=644221 RepID=A0A395JNU0_9GAMM|nr:CBS domain-containing protein [Arenicella xantha]RBP53167.1 magnesium and cobalt transporter [Arenicella xantha]
MNAPEKPPSKFTQLLKNKLWGLLPQQRAETREDVLENLRQAEEDGIVARDAYDMMQRVMYVSDLKVRDIMVPRSNMAFVEREHALDQCLDVMVDSGHSRFPVVDNEKDMIVGILLAKDLLHFFDDDNKQRFNLRDLTRPVVFIPESKRLNVLLSEFRENRNHMAIVVDEFGAIAGLVTIEDVLEQIVGNIEDEHDVEDDESLIRTLEDGEVIVKAVLPISEFNEHFQCYLSEANSDTIGGLVSQTIGHVPMRGESVEIDKFNFEVIHSDSRRIHLIRVKQG